jgi:predicted dehydrogenase
MRAPAYAQYVVAIGVAPRLWPSSTTYPRSTPDYRAMIDSSELDALVVVMPVDLHHPMVMAGVEAGLHVLCEKPMAFMADRSGGNAGGRAGAGEAHGAVHQSRAAA